MNNSIIEVTVTELQDIEGGNGAYCGLAAGLAVGAAVAFGPETLLFTWGKVVAVCAADYLG